MIPNVGFNMMKMYFKKKNYSKIWDVTFWYQSNVSDDLLGCGVLVLGRITLSGGVFVTPGPEQLWLRHFLIQGIS